MCRSERIFRVLHDENNNDHEVRGGATVRPGLRSRRRPPARAYRSHGQNGTTGIFPGGPAIGMRAMGAL